MSGEQNSSDKERSIPLADPKLIEPPAKHDPKLIAPPAVPLTPEQVLQRRSEEADITAVFTGQDVTNRPVVSEEKDALEDVVKKRLGGGDFKVVPFDFGGSDDKQPKT